MRRHFLQASLEADNNTQNPYAGLVLSAEEDQQLLTEALQDEATVTSDLAEAARMNDLADALEDLAVVADDITANGAEPTPVETQLIESATQMAVAGTEVTPEEIIPAMESADKGRKVSLETLRETAKKLFDRVMAVLKGIWDKINNFFYKIFGTIPGLRRAIKDAKQKVDDNSSRTPDTKKIIVNVGVNALSVNFKAPASEGDIKAAVASLMKVNEFIYGAGADKVHAMGEAIAEGLEQFDPEQPQKSLGAFVSKLGKKQDEFSKIPGMHSGAGDRWPGFEVKISEPLAGNVSIVARTPKDLDLSSNDVNINKLEQLRKLSFEVVATSEASHQLATSFEMPTMSNKAMMDVLNDADKLLETLEKFQRGSRHTNAAKLRTKISAASDKASKAVAKLDGENESAHRDAIPYYRSMLNFNTAYARWTKDPAMPMVGHTLATVRGVLSVVDKSLKDYK